MADINHIITQGIGSPAGILEFITVGLQIGDPLNLDGTTMMGYVMLNVMPSNSVRLSTMLSSDVQLNASVNGNVTMAGSQGAE